MAVVRRLERARLRGLLVNMNAQDRIAYLTYIDHGGHAESSSYHLEGSTRVRVVHDSEQPVLIGPTGFQGVGEGSNAGLTIQDPLWLDTRQVTPLEAQWEGLRVPMLD